MFKTLNDIPSSPFDMTLKQLSEEHRICLSDTTTTKVVPVALKNSTTKAVEKKIGSPRELLRSFRKKTSGTSSTTPIPMSLSDTPAPSTLSNSPSFASPQYGGQERQSIEDQPAKKVGAADVNEPDVPPSTTLTPPKSTEAAKLLLLSSSSDNTESTKSSNTEDSSEEDSDSTKNDSKDDVFNCDDGAYLPIGIESQKLGSIPTKIVKPGDFGKRLILTLDNSPSLSDSEESSDERHEESSSKSDDTYSVSPSFYSPSISDSDTYSSNSGSDSRSYSEGDSDELDSSQTGFGNYDCDPNVTDGNTNDTDFLADSDSSSSSSEGRSKRTSNQIASDRERSSKSPKTPPQSAFDRTFSRPRKSIMNLANSAGVNSSVGSSLDGLQSQSNRTKCSATEDVPRLSAAKPRVPLGLTKPTAQEKHDSERRHLPRNKRKTSSRTLAISKTRGKAKETVPAEVINHKLLKSVRRKELQSTLPSNDTTEDSPACKKLGLSAEIPTPDPPLLPHRASSLQDILYCLYIAIYPISLA